MAVFRIPTLGLLLALVCLFVQQAVSVQRDSLYPFGEFRNDQRMSIGDDISTSEIQLQTPIAFFENTYRSIFINLNGHLSFETEIPAYKNDLILPFGFKIIAPFLADVDTRLSGNVYYRETRDASLLETATREIQRNFPIAITFSAESLLIVTWDMVGYFKEQYDQTNTFQVVIATDGFDSYAFFHYVDDGINWVQSQGKNMPVHADPPAQAGFDAGDFTRYYTLPGSGHPEVRNLAGWSNINVPGAWLFRIGHLGGGNIELPPSDDREYIEVDEPENAGEQTCASGGAATCSSDATCEDHARGFCCKCVAGYYGNGVNCLQKGTAQRINGRVSGNVNNIVIDPVVLHTYVVTSDGRAYTAISRMPQLIGNSLQTIYTIGGIMGWLFSVPSSPTSQNGFTITGGEFNRTAVIQFVAGGETLRVHDHFEGQGVHGYMKVTTTLNGNIPTVADKARVTVDDYKEEYKRTAPGEIKSFTTHTYRIDGVPYRFTVDQTITYKECAAAPSTIESHRLTVNRNFITFDDREQIVRFAQSNRILAVSGGAVDPCANSPCGPNSRCRAEGQTYTCRCSNGYRGDAEGKNCVDIDECTERTHDCDYNAQCVNFEGTFDCRCNQGYRGNGRQCERDLTCGEVSCDVNARCVFDSEIGQPRCECNTGFVGTGTECDAVEFSCNEVNNCGENAECLYDPAQARYVCECMDGFSGDGYTCTSGGEPIRPTRPPGPTQPTRATYPPRPTQPRPTYPSRPTRPRLTYPPRPTRPRPTRPTRATWPPRPTRPRPTRPTQAPTTSTTTRREEVSCRNCDANAHCTYDVNLFRFRCECKEGYTGDGYSCDRVDSTGEFDDCSVLRNCDYNAQCVYDDTHRRHRCVCNPGYQGDGYRCQEERQDCSVANICDVNAQCAYDNTYRRYMCRCNPGFEGDGFVCRASGGSVIDSCNVINNCGVNAECLYDERQRSHSCRCRQGYEGDGYTCTATLDCLRDPGICDSNARCVRQGYDHVCQCNTGYYGDGRRCAPENRGDGESYLLYAQGLSIMQMPLNPTDDNPGKQLLLIPGQTAVGIDVDCYSRYFYWTDISGKTISRARLDGTDSEVLLSGLGSPEGVSVDWVAGNMYWTDSEKDVIEVSKTDGTNRKVLFNTNIHDPRAIAVDPVSGLVFWTDWQRKAPKIEVANMDGTGRRVLFDKDLGLPNGLAVDFRGRQICWADAGTMHIECANHDGRGRRTVYSLASYPFGLTLAGDTFYWTDWDMKSMPSIDKFGGTPYEPKKLPVGGNGKTYGISTVRAQCPAGSNACVLNNGGCRFLCLPTPNGGRTCTCPDDIEDDECNRISLLK